MDAAGSDPLALSLAADLALQSGVRDFADAPQWRLLVRSLVDRQLTELSDPELRDEVEACAVVRQFDEATLAAVSGRDDVRTLFSQLCRLSLVTPAEHGLMLQADPRRRLSEDLAWRNSDRYNALRARARAYLRKRAISAPPSERAWLVAERLFLSDNPRLQQMFVSSADDPGQVRVQPAQPRTWRPFGDSSPAGYETFLRRNFGTVLCLRQKGTGHFWKRFCRTTAHGSGLRATAPVRCSVSARC
jgi:hypothetical protein